MFEMFHRKGPKPTPTPDGDDLAQGNDGLIQPESPLALLSTARRRRLMESIWQRTSLSPAQFVLLYRAPIERYAALVQRFPASEAHHHSYDGGMLDHALEAVVCALKLRQSHLLPVGAPAETQAAQAEAWTTAIACASLLHDIGKIAVDIHVEYADGQRWRPWHGPLTRPYKFRYQKDRVYRLHDAAAGLLYRDVLNSTILDWLSGFPELWAAFLYVLAGQYEHAGILGELVKQADQASAAQQLGGDPEKARNAPKHALQRKLVDGLRYLARESLRLNQPQASDGWLTDDGLWLVAKTVCDKLRAHLLSQGFEGIPDSNVAVFNVLQDHGLVQPNRDRKAIWRATVTSRSGWTHTFTLLKLSPALIWETGDRPAPYEGTVRVEVGGDDTREPEADAKAEPQAAQTPRWPTAPPSQSSEEPDAVDSALALLCEDSAAASLPPESSHDNISGPTAAEFSDMTQRPGFLPKPHEESPGSSFLTWLRDGIASRRLKINDAKALVHTVDDTAFLVTPGVFQRYLQEHPELVIFAKQEKTEGWQWAQKQFERLRLHKKQTNGLNIWTCEVTGPRKSRHLHGYLLNDSTSLFSEAPPNNPYLKLR